MMHSVHYGALGAALATPLPALFPAAGSTGTVADGFLAARPSRACDDAWASDRVGPAGFAVMNVQSLTGCRWDWCGVAVATTNR
jgi:hypothetical protein